MYLDILEKSSTKISEYLENHFGFYLQQFKEASDKEDLLRQMFIRLFADKNVNEEAFVDAYEQSIGQEHLDLFYNYLWWTLNNPRIENFGKRFLEEMNDSPLYQIHLLRQYMYVLTQTYADLHYSHSQLLSRFVKVEDQQEVEEMLHQEQEPEA